jgi:hypothetical protein
LKVSLFFRLETMASHWPSTDRHRLSSQKVNIVLTFSVYLPKIEPRLEIYFYLVPVAVQKHTAKNCSFFADDQLQLKNTGIG